MRVDRVRAAGAALLAAIVWVFARRSWGDAGAAAAALAAAAAGVWALPRLALVRLLWAVPLFALVLFVTVQLMFLVPGDPFASEKNVPEAVREMQRAHYGVLEKTPWGATRFFGNYVKGLVAEGYMGPCIKVQGRSVADVLLPALPVSMTLGLLALILATGIGLVLGIRAGLRPNSFTDHASMGFALMGISLPSFVLGALFVIAFSFGFPFAWFPVAGWGTWRHLALPAVALALPIAAVIARLARSGTIEVMNQDFIRTARAKGLAPGVVVVKHALKGAILPVVSYLGPAAAAILTGGFVVETLFNVPGLGRWFVNGALSRDYYVILGTVFIECGLVICFNLLVDLAYPWLDPRLRRRT